MDQISPWVGIAGLFVTVFSSAVAVAFGMGRLTQRVSQLEQSISADSGHHDAVVRLEVEMKHATDKLDSLDRGMAGVNRQLANISTQQFGNKGEARQ